MIWIIVDCFGDSTMHYAFGCTYYEALLDAWAWFPYDKELDVKLIA